MSTETRTSSVIPGAFLRNCDQHKKPGKPAVFEPFKKVVMVRKAPKAAGGLRKNPTLNSLKSQRLSDEGSKINLRFMDQETNRLKRQRMISKTNDHMDADGDLGLKKLGRALGGKKIDRGLGWKIVDRGFSSKKVDRGLGLKKVDPGLSCDDPRVHCHGVLHTSASSEVPSFQSGNSSRCESPVTVLRPLSPAAPASLVSAAISNEINNLSPVLVKKNPKRERYFGQDSEINLWFTGQETRRLKRQMCKTNDVEAEGDLKLKKLECVFGVKKMDRVLGSKKKGYQGLGFKEVDGSLGWKKADAEGDLRLSKLDRGFGVKKMDLALGSKKKVDRGLGFKEVNGSLGWKKADCDLGCDGPQVHCHGVLCTSATSEVSSYQSGNLSRCESPATVLPRLCPASPVNAAISDEINNLFPRRAGRVVMIRARFADTVIKVHKEILSTTNGLQTTEAKIARCRAEEIVRANESIKNQQRQKDRETARRALEERRNMSSLKIISKP